MESDSTVYYCQKTASLKQQAAVKWARVVALIFLQVV